MTEKFTFAPDAFVKVESLFGSYKISRLIKPSDDSFAAGFARMDPGDRWDVGYWYHEVFLIMDGELEIVSSSPPFEKEICITFKKNDLMYIPKAAQVKMRVVGEKPCLIFYFTVPFPWIGWEGVDRAKER